MDHSADGPRRTQAERRAKSEEALVRAAAELIAERGIEQSTLVRIGERSGVSRALTTYHFGTKDALVARLARQAQDRIRSATQAALKKAERRADEVPALELLRVMVGAYFRLFENPTPQDRALIVMWGATFPSESAAKGMVEVDRRTYDGWADLIRRGQRDGSIRSEVDPTAAAVVLLGLTRGVAAVLATNAGARDMRNVRRTCDAFINAALAAPDTRAAARGHRAKRSSR